MNLQRCPIPLSCMLLFHTHPEMILYQSKSEHHTAAVIQNNNTKIWISVENKGFTLLLINNEGVSFLKELVLHLLGIITSLVSNMDWEWSKFQYIKEITKLDQLCNQRWSRSILLREVPHHSLCPCKCSEWYRNLHWRIFHNLL